jgi:hypothetical protein
MCLSKRFNAYRREGAKKGNLMKCDPIFLSKTSVGRGTAVAGVSLVVLVLAAAAARAQTCTYTKFTVNGNITGANSVNKYGTVVGSYNSNPSKYM